MAIMLHGAACDNGSRNEPGNRNNVATFDLSMLFEEWSEKPHVVTRLVDCFIRQTQKDLHAMTAASDVRDPVQLASAAHGLKGSAGTLGVECIRGEAARLEDFARKHQWSDALEAVQTLQWQFEHFCEYAARLSPPVISCSERRG